MISQIFFPNLWRHRHLLSTRCWYLQHPELCSCNNLLLAPPSFINECMNDPSTSWLYFAQNSPATHCSAACFALTLKVNQMDPRPLVRFMHFMLRLWLARAIGCPAMSRDAYLSELISAETS